MDLMGRIQQLEKQVARLEKTQVEVAKIFRDYLAVAKNERLYRHIQATDATLSKVAARVLSPEEVDEAIEKLGPPPSLPPDLEKFLGKL